MQRDAEREVDGVNPGVRDDALALPAINRGAINPCCFRQLDDAASNLDHVINAHVDNMACGHHQRQERLCAERLKSEGEW